MSFTLGSEESDKWEACIDYIPAELFPTYAPLVAGFTLNNRISLYKLLYLESYSYDFCRVILHILFHISDPFSTLNYYELYHQIDEANSPLKEQSVELNSLTDGYGDDQTMLTSQSGQTSNSKVATHHDHVVTPLLPPITTSSLNQTPTNLLPKSPEASIQLSINEFSTTNHVDINISMFNNDPNSYIPILLNYLHRIRMDRIRICIDLLFHLKGDRLIEYLTIIPSSMFEYFLELWNCISDFEKMNMIELINSLSVQELDGILKKCNTPLAKHCSLCRTKRIYNLEHRLNYAQIAEGAVESVMPGMIDIYEKNTMIWSADDENNFTFDEICGKVFWHKQPVDLMVLCDKCLNDTHRAMSSITRFESTSHVNGYARKDIRTELRKHEKKRSEIIAMLAVERIRRRAREFSLRVLKCHREYLIKLQKDEEARLARIERERQEAAVQAAKMELLHKAMSLDKKWHQFDENMARERASYKEELAELKWKPKYTDENPCPPVREHPHSWKLSQYGAQQQSIVDEQVSHNNGQQQRKLPLPLGPEAAVKRFGTGEFVPDVRTKELTEYKEKAVELYSNYEARLREEEERRKAEHDAEIKHLRQYMAETLYNADRAAKLRQREADQAEEDRIIQRQKDKEARREARIARQEAEERALMAVEDELSWWRRYDEHDVEVMTRELKLMADAEAEQTKIDRFWGIPTSILREKERLAAERRKWEGRVDELRKMCIEVRVTRPFSWEYGQFRDRVTNKPIT